MAKAKQQQTPTAVVDPACAPEWTDILRQMIFIRRFEEATEREFRRGKIGGYLHVYIGQEAVASGIISALQKDDLVFCGYRDHAQALALGSDPGKVMAELFGKGTGLSKGKGGSMHLFDVEHGLYGGYGIVGGHLTLATGAAYALRYQRTERIVVCYFGDGAMNIGSFHEAMNMAGLWGKDGKCPIVFIIENNGYAMGTSVERHSALTDLAARVRAYNIQSEKVDGQDIFAVRGVADRVVRQVRETGKPYCIEAVTYRFSGHGAADILQPYRTKDEVEEHRHRDPITILRTRLSEVCGLSDDDVKKMEESATEEVAKALKFAEESPAPDPQELFTDVVAEHGPASVNRQES
ncbi:MAG TPA: pyruvate dehydrogenase (acetyl-transferring) E1 component subunit alpha [Thermoanaerobaculia bacterium]|jgi:pyruvate dehydrogenase E1 component alpha subunit|nr:pyruvate dehydrogenase (acetyl-transferring) E1 component subunit alpha [Thermoanaerobaculia bacterium]